MKKSVIALALLMVLMLVSSTASAEFSISIPSMHESVPSNEYRFGGEPNNYAGPGNVKGSGDGGGTPPWVEVMFEGLREQIERVKSGENYVKGERIVVFKPGASRSSMDSLALNVGALSSRNVAKFGRAGEERAIRLLKFESEEAASRAEIELKRSPDVLYVCKNIIFSVPPTARFSVTGSNGVGGSIGVSGGFTPQASTADPFRSYQWYLYKTKEQFAPFAQTAPCVAVIDTGVYYYHEELAGRVILGPDYVDDDDDPLDEHGHGTAVAGVIAAKVNNARGIAGISPRSMIYAVRVLDENGTGTFDDVLAGIINATETEFVKIINLSLGGYVGYGSDEYWAMEYAIDYAVHEMGKIVVSAAGNEDNFMIYLNDFPETPYYDVVPIPAAIPSSFTVAGTDERDARVFFSNYPTSRCPDLADIAAPAFRILTLNLPWYGWFMGRSGYSIWSGTSFSAPIIAAAAARVWGKNPTWSNYQVMNHLINTGRLLGAEKGFPYAIRRVDIAKALGITLTGIQGQVLSAESWDWRGLDGLGGVKVTATTTKYAYSVNGGFYTITGLAPGTYTLKASKSGYVTETLTVTVTAGSITEDVDFYMVRVKPTDTLTVVATWNLWNPGMYETYWWYGWFEHPDMPQFYEVAGREMDAKLQILPDNIVISPEDWRYSCDPYAEVTSDSYQRGRPIDAITYKPKSGKNYNFGLSLNPYRWNWGKIAGSMAVVKVYKGSSIIATISSAAATGISDFWLYAYKQAGTGSITSVNKRTPMLGVQVPSPTPQILLVAQDEYYAGWFKSALEDAGYSYAYWNVYEAGPPSAGDLSAYAITIWSYPWGGPNKYERTSISGYLAAGKKLFISGQDIGWYLNLWFMQRWSDAPEWYRNTLKAEYVFDAIQDMVDDYGYYGIRALLGINGDPISDPEGSLEGNEMALVIEDGDGADNQDWPDGIVPYGGSAAIFYYLDEGGNIFTLGGNLIAGGIRYPSGVPAPATPYRLVYLSFGFEAINDAGTRAQLMDEIIKFLNTGS